MVEIGFSQSVADFYSMRWEDPTKTIVGLETNVEAYSVAKKFGGSWGRKPLGGAS
jgi:hypothetical protein